MKFKNKFGKKRKDSDDSDEDFQESKKWYLEISDGPKEFPTVTDQQIIDLKEEAKVCHDSETANYNIKNARYNSNYQWMKTVMTKGTVSDKIASHTVLIQEDPIHNLQAIRNFIGMVKVSKKNECISVMDTLTELFLGDLLHPNRKLQSFDQKPLTIIDDLTSGNAVTRRKYLSAWYFEDQLKELYDSFISSLNTAAHDTVDLNKEKAIGCMYKLLAGNPEQEKRLLSLIVNKLGDPSQKVASKAIYCLGQLLRKHSNMQNVVLKEVEKLLFRSNVSTKSQYYGLCFLSQFYLNHDENEIAKKLIDVYFGFFKACVKKGEVDSRMMSALLMGVNRAYPYAKLETDKITEHIDTIYRVVHIANFNVSLQALNLLFQVSDCTSSISDRFYSALYKKLLDPQVGTTTHQAMLLSLIYKALIKDKEVNRVKALVKRLLQLSINLPPNFSCGILYIVSQLISRKKDVHSIVQQQQSLDNLDEDEDDEEKYTDVQTEIEVKEEILSDEEDAAVPSENVAVPLENVDQLNDSKEISLEIDEKPDIKPEIENGTGSWYHRDVKKEKVVMKKNSYDPIIRNPLYAGAEFTAFFELNYLRQHFHPTVSLFATNILNGEKIRYTGDPLKDFTIIRFLDRFVFKNPKKSEIMENGSHPTFGQRKLYKPRGVKSLPVTSKTYMQSLEKNIPVDEKFLYVYLNKKYGDRPSKEENDDDDDDLDSVASDEFEEMLEKMGGMPRDEDEDLDYMNDIGDNLKKKGQDNEKNEDDEDSEGSESDEDAEDDLSDDENELDESNLMEDGDEDLIGDLDDDDDDEEINFDDSDDETPKKSKKSKNRGTNSIFASAEEFATILEDEGSSKRKPGSSNTLSNKDSADTKQINWEEKRNRWLSGYDQAMGKKRGNKRANFNKSGNNKKKFKQK